MTFKFDIGFSKSAAVSGGVALLMKAADGAVAGGAEADPAGILENAMRIGKFTGKSLAVIDIVAPHGSSADRILVLGLGKPASITAHDWLKAGGAAAAKVRSADSVTIFLDAPGIEVTAKAVTDFAL